MTNSGTIMSNAADNFAVMLRAGGTVTNTGLIEGGDGVLVDGDNATVSNAAGARSAAITTGSMSAAPMSASAMPA